MKNPAGLSCPLCGVRACTYEPNTKKSPSFCPMQVESEQLAAIERTYLEDEELRKLGVRIRAHGVCRLLSQHTRPGDHGLCPPHWGHQTGNRSLRGPHRGSQSRA